MKPMLELIDTDAGLLLVCRACSKQDVWQRDSTQSTEHFAIAVFDEELVQIKIKCRVCRMIGMYNLRGMT